MSNISKLQSRLKKINPKNKKKIKLYKNRIKVQVDSKDSNYKRNWYICNDELNITEAEADSFLDAFENKVDTSNDLVYHKYRSLFLHSSNRFYLHSYKQQKFITSILQREQLATNIYKTTFSSHLQKSLVEPGNFRIFFISEDQNILNDIIHLDVFEGFDFTSIQKFKYDFFLRALNIYSLDSLFSLLDSQEFTMWFVRLNRLNGLCFVHYQSRFYEIQHFLYVLYFFLYTTNLYVVNEKTEDLLKSDFMSLLNPGLQDPDNVLYKNFESDLYTAFQESKKDGFKENVIKPTELELKYPSSLSLVKKVSLHTSTLNFKSTGITGQFMKKIFGDIVFISNFISNLKNQL